MHHKNRRLRWLWLVCSLSLFTLGVLTVAYASLKDEESFSYDYHGLMRIVDLVDFTFRRYKSSSKYHHYSVAVVLVEWACPAADYDENGGNFTDTNSTNISCLSHLDLCSFEVCTTKLPKSNCSQVEYSYAANQTMACMNDLFSLDGNYTEYDPLANPSSDVDWPSVEAYGNCQTCEVTLSITETATVRGLRIVCWCLLAWTILILSSFVVLRKRWRPRPRQRPILRPPPAPTMRQFGSTLPPLPELVTDESENSESEYQNEPEGRNGDDGGRGDGLFAMYMQKCDP